MKEYINTEKGLVVTRGSFARKLLRKNYTIIDVKPDRANTQKTVFIFRIENDIENELKRLFLEEKANRT